ncbi:unnamed protein product [Brachionus calyciflorus]|uniref:C2H2-type domain-containing protein n=1 Tax=Brachionus calyciflorus TaxID=104777 RepID=A0A813WX01_9BILA|nr:unnamed protein product [Brachionus calyciflorus]
MDETVYQCPECNFNADNLNELDSHIIENHSNENANNFKQNFRNKNYSNGYSNSLSTQNDDMTLRDDEDFDENNEIENFEDDEDFFNERNNTKENYQNGNYQNEEYEDNGYEPNDASEFPADEEEDFFSGNTDDNYKVENENEDDSYYQNTISTSNNLSITQIKKNSIVPTSQNSTPNVTKYRPIKPNLPIPEGPVINSDNHYERQYTCKRCDFFTNNPRAVLYHRKEFHNEKINVHECQYCQYASQYSGKVERHTLLRHKIDMTNNNKYTPNKTQTIKTDLNDSNVLNQSTNQLAKNDLNNSQNQSKFQCNKCPCKYKRSSDLTKHMRLKHPVIPNAPNNYSNISINSNTNINSNQIENNIKEENEDFENNDTTQNNSNSLNRTAYMNRNFNQIQKKILNSEENGLSKPPQNPQQSQHQQQIISNPNPNTYQCPYCTFYTSLEQSSEYLLHVKDHLCGKAFRCVLCNSVYKYRGDCVVHLKRKHQKADMIAHSYVDKFNLDNLNINDIYGLLKPKEIDEPENDEKLYGCSYCDYKANYKGDVYKHQTRRHPGTAKSVLSLATQNTTVLSNCSSENNSVNNSFNLGGNNTINNGHGYIDDAENQQNYYQQEDEIMQDEEEDFFNEKAQNNYEEEYNENYVNYAENINEHEEKIEADPVKNKCKFCPFVGRSQAKVQLHMATHYNLKQYMCPTCKKRANFKWDIQKHMRKIHNDYQSEVVILSESEARQSIGSYMENKPYVLEPNILENSSSGSNLSAPQKILNSQFYEAQSGQSSPLIYNGFNLNQALGSDTTGNKKFRCTVCPYRSNWKADMYRHLRKRHAINQPKIEDVIVLNPDEAASSLEEYERLHGINIRKRARFDDVYRSNATSSASNDGFQSDHETKRFKTDSSSVISTSDEQNQFGSGMEDEGLIDSDEGVNGYVESDTNYESDAYNSQNGVERLPVSIAELNIKPYKCIKCGFRSDRKSDTLRHIRVKHSIQPLQAFKFLRILSIKEASESIEEYESTRIYKKVKPNNRDFALINTIVQQTNQNLDPNSALSNLKYLAKNSPSQTSINSQCLNGNPVQKPNRLNSQNSNRLSTGLDKLEFFNRQNGHGHQKSSVDFFRCPFCSFKHKSRVCMKKHLANHFYANQIKQNILYKCSACNFKSDWQYTCKKHILTCHMPNGLNAQVIKIKPKVITEANNKHVDESQQQKGIKILIKRNENGNSAQIVKNEMMETENDNETENDQENDLNHTIETSIQEERKTRIFVNDEDKKYQESVVLTGWDGQQFTSTYFVSNACVFNGSQNGANGVPIGKKTKMFYCQNCPYKTNNYCTFKQHLLQHKFRDGFYKCRYCPYYVGMIRLLKQHEVIHTEYAPRESCSLESQNAQNGLMKNLESHQMPIAQ